MSDPLFSNVSLLLKCDGANGSTTFPDLSSAPKNTFVSPTAGSATVSTAQSKFGGGSLYLDGALTPYLGVTGTAGLLFPGDFTFEFWFNTPTLAAKYIAGWDGASYFEITGAGAVGYTQSGSITSANGTLVAGTWAHIALCRVGSTVTLYVDGVSVGSYSNGSPMGGSGGFTIGTYSGGTPSLTAYFDEIRVTKGVSRYSAAFTPPTAAFEYVAVTATITTIAPMATVVAYGGANGRVSAPMPVALGYGGANLAVSVPMATVQGYGGGNARVTVPMATVHGAAHDSTGENAFSITLPMATVQAQGGANARMTVPMATLAATGTVTNLAQINATVPMATVQATGKVSAMANADITIPMATVIGYGGAVCEVTIGMATVQATGTTGGVGRLVATLPLFQVTATGSSQNHGSFNIVLPMARLGGANALVATIPMATLTAIGTAVVAVSYEAYSINLTHKPRAPGQDPAVDEVTHYTNFPFTHIVRYKGSYFGAAADGLYLLEGTTDAGTAIPYAVRTAIDDFGTAEKKTIDAAYFGGRLGPGATVTLTAGETGAQTYAFTTPRGQLAQGHRQKFGKGVKDRYFALGVAGTDAMRLDNLELVVNKLTRKI